MHNPSNDLVIQFFVVALQRLYQPPWLLFIFHLSLFEANKLETAHYPIYLFN